MEDKILAILQQRRVMAVATLRSDGWPQATMVSYVNRGVVLYFLISRTSQKFKNISADDRVSIAIGADAAVPAQIEGLSMAARAIELRDEPYRSQMLAELSARHPGYFDAATLDMKASALIRALPEIISVVDFSKGLGHEDYVTVGADEVVEMTAVRQDNWGPDPAR
jgi:nitroimidazol reductase NimA-like FMN-containing flavoprotein (pyridoxamine 5'-phosphate oxidase superfamily)